MKKIYISEAQEKILFREAMQGGFSFKNLEMIGSFRGRVNYATEHFGSHIGKGSSRMVFQIDDEWILKLAINEKGIAQNEVEAQYDYYKDEMSCFPHINREMSDMQGYKFIVSEYVLPAKSADFKHCFNMTFNEFASFIRKCGEHQSRYGLYGAMDEENFYELIEEDDDLREIYDYISNYDAPIGDLTRIANWGITMRDGYPTMVILDSGLTHDVLRNYYSR